MPEQTSNSTTPQPPALNTNSQPPRPQPTPDPTPPQSPVALPSARQSESDTNGQQRVSQAIGVPSTSLLATVVPTWLGVLIGLGGLVAALYFGYKQLVSGNWAAIATYRSQCKEAFELNMTNADDAEYADCAKLLKTAPTPPPILRRVAERALDEFSDYQARFHAVLVFTVLGLASSLLYTRRASRAADFDHWIELVRLSGLFSGLASLGILFMDTKLTLHSRCPCPFCVTYFSGIPFFLSLLHV
ncbi:hypothetical protein F4801DRAFT_536043 [Xylaria longipes]|nr:hypothetical protein F4801DRAFT_536043 [Xylaria longipes]